MAAGLATALGVPAGPVAAFESSGGRLSLWQSSTSGPGAGRGAAALGLPMAANGAPDFAALTAAGAKVTGALPGGYSEVTYIGDGGTTTVYAAVIERSDGSAPFLVRGADLRSAEGSSRAERQASLEAVTAYLRELPDTVEEARQRIWAGSPSASPGSARSTHTIDTRA
ncbi:hypothetical protein CLV92_105288 [Kineococcus xinjiangensis]|uniref:Uncharacterized protein n=1 Tax=Kineococcus xinjiangensis TaxID=512762 RepID=A0A2S6IQ08_9ACTN|nr:hypothetical protein [Kineococcus xinjiangensis]PPK96186.1 hypothetical protein CLV92_105288 [Kineococcus xinjiangensis]